MSSRRSWHQEYLYDSKKMTYASDGAMRTDDDYEAKIRNVMSCKMW